MSEKHVVVWADGLIDLMKAEPEGGISIAHGEEKQLERALAATARLAYDGEHWIAPEVRDAHIGLKQTPSTVALALFQDRLKAALGRISKAGVVN